MAKNKKARVSKYARQRILQELSNLSTIKNMVDNDIVYLHNNVRYFERGYKTVANTVNTFIYNTFDKYRKEFMRYGNLLRQAEKNAYRELGVRNGTDLNNAYQAYLKSGSSGDFFRALALFNQIKTGVWQVRASVYNEYNSTDKKQQEAMIKQYASSELNDILSRIQSSDAATGLERVLDILDGANGNLDIWIGNATEQLLKEGLQEQASQATANNFLSNVSKVLAIANREQKTNTGDLKMITQSGMQIVFSVKTSVGLDENGEISSKFTASRGYEGRKKSESSTMYNVNTAFDSETSKEEYSLLLYILYNHKVLNLSQFVLGTLETLRIGLAWRNAMDAIFGSDFKTAVANGRITEFPLFLMTLDSVIPMSDICTFLGTSDFWSMQGMILKSGKYDRFMIQDVSVKGKMNTLLALKTQELGGYEVAKTKKQLTYPQLFNKLKSNFASYSSSLSKSLMYRVQYRISLSNITNQL